MLRNVEIKAKARDWSRQMLVAQHIATAPRQHIKQHDTFFRCNSGYLKLRDFGDGLGELIRYDRPSARGPKTSRYHITLTDEPVSLRTSLSASLGIEIAVKKRRIVFLVGQTRIHFDEVDELGRYIELEVVLDEGQTESYGRNIANELMRQLDIQPADLVADAYADMLRDQEIHRKTTSPASTNMKPITSNKLCPKVIIEGTRLTQKTEIAFALNEHPGFVGPRKYRYHSPLVSAEWCGFTNTPWGRGLINFNADEETRAMETYRTWIRLFELLRHYSWIVDRFHLSTIVHQQRVRGAEYDFAWLEERLVALGFRLILCVRSEDTFKTARATRIEVSGNPSQYDDLDVFVSEQASIRKAARASILPTLELDVSDSDVAKAADRVVAWLEQTGGLTEQ